MKYIIVTLFTILLFFKSSTAQTPLKQYTTANAIISNTVYYAYRDSKGYLWFATDKGVSVYDGYNFRNYTMLDGLSDNDVFRFYEDLQKRLWLFTYNGTLCYIKDGRVYNQNNDTFLKKLPIISYVNAMYDGGSKGLYIGYTTGQVLLIKNNSINWVIGRTIHTGISTIYPEGNFVNVFSAKIRYVLDGDKIVKSIKSKLQCGFYFNKKLLASDSFGFKVFDKGELTLDYSNVALTCNDIINLYGDEKDNIFCSGKNGLVIINYKTRERIDLLQNLKVTSVVQDVQNNYWITTIGNGIFCLNKDFRELRFVKNLRNERIDVTNDGYIFFSEDKKVWELKNAGLQPINMQFESDQIPVYNSDQFFIFTDGSISGVLNKQYNRITHSRMSLKFAFPHSVEKLFLVGFDNNIYNATIAAHKFVITHTFKLYSRPIDARISRRRDKVFLLHANALRQYNLIDSSISLVDTFKDGLAVSIATAGNHVLLLMNNREVLTYDMTTFQKKLYTPKNLSFYSFFELGDGDILVNTSNGYYLMHGFNGDFNQVTQEKLEYPFRQSDILSLYPFHDSILCNINSGLYLFSKKLLNRQLAAPIFYIDKITARNKTYDRGPVIIKNASECNVSIFLHALGFNNLRNSYKYRITSGKETSEWFSSDGTAINIRVSGYGNHQIEIMAVTENNIASPVRRLQVSLLPPFYWSWWFISLSAAVISYVIFLGLRMHNKRQQRIYEHELEFMQLENKAINSLLNPHFIFNAINNIQNLVASNAPEMANEYLAKLSRLIRQNIENLQFNFVSLEKELGLIKNYIYLQNLRFGNVINLEITHSLDAAGVNIPPLLIHTFVENAVVHGFTKQINPFIIIINIETTNDDYLKITIKDNGRGLAASKNKDNGLPKVSLGIAFTRKRLERISAYYGIKYHLEIADLADSGATGTITTLIIHSGLGKLPGV